MCVPSLQVWLHAAPACCQSGPRHSACCIQSRRATASFIDTHWCALPRPAPLAALAGAQQALSDASIADILADMRPQLRSGDFNAAVERGVVDVGLTLAGGRPKGEGATLLAGPPNPLACPSVVLRLPAMLAALLLPPSRRLCFFLCQGCMQHTRPVQSPAHPLPPSLPPPALSAGPAPVGGGHCLSRVGGQLFISNLPLPPRLCRRRRGRH